MGEEGGASVVAFDGMLKGWPDKPLEIKQYSSNPKNNFIIDLAARLYANCDWIHTEKTDDTLAKECLSRANTLAGLLGGLFE